MFEKNTHPEILEKEDSVWIMEWFLWRDRLSTAVRDFPKNAQGNSQGIWRSFVHRNFSLLNFIVNYSHTLVQMEMLPQRAFEDSVSLLCVVWDGGWYATSV